MNVGQISVGAAHPRSRPSTSVYAWTSAVGAAGYVGGLIVAVGLEETLGNIVRMASIVLFIAVGVVRERLSKEPTPYAGSGGRIERNESGAQATPPPQSQDDAQRNGDARTTPKSSTGNMLDELLVGLCTPQVQAELRAEVEVLIQQFAPEADPASLQSAAKVLDDYSDGFEIGRSRMRLWGAMLRLRAAEDHRSAGANNV